MTDYENFIMKLYSYLLDTFKKTPSMNSEVLKGVILKFAVNQQTKYKIKMVSKYKREQKKLEKLRKKKVKYKFEKMGGI